MMVGQGDESSIHHPPTARRRRGRDRPRISLNLTAMIDVTFLLLIYFMAATQFKLGEEIYRLDLPERQPSMQTDPFDLDEEPLRIRVATIGTDPRYYSLNLDGPYPQPRTFEELFDFGEVIHFLRRQVVGDNGQLVFQ